MKVRASLFAALLAVLMSGSACSAPDSIAGIGVPTASPDLVAGDTAMYRLTGHGNYSIGSQPDIAIDAVRTFKGEMKGTVVIPKDGFGKVGSVIELIPPGVDRSHWCVASTIDDQPGYNYLIYVNDVPEGIDQVTFGSGPGATCSDFLFPFFEWNSLVTGNFTGTVKTK